MIRTTAAQLAEMRKSIEMSNVNRNEKVWTFLVATLFDTVPDQSNMVERLCGEPLNMDHRLDIWFEGQPIPPRKGTAGDSEGNTKLDLAFGHVVPREGTGAGIAYGPPQPGSWVCFVEAKCLSDCSTTVSYDPLRNQIARVIENLLCFQGEGQFPERLFFTLLTPRLFMQHPNARLYGYKMREYFDHEKLLTDIKQCCIPCRSNSGYIYPDLLDRLGALRMKWVCYEDLLEPEFGTNLDIVSGPGDIEGLKQKIVSAIDSAERGKTVAWKGAEEKPNGSLPPIDREFT